jgi:hypothetical protein
MFVLDDAGATLAGMAVIGFGYVVFGLTGFGASLFTVPVLWPRCWTLRVPSAWASTAGARPRCTS